MIPRYRAWFGSEMYDKPVVYDGEFFLDWRDFENRKTYDGAVLMQSTGLFDKNGKEIFEGDIFTYLDDDNDPIYENIVVKFGQHINMDTIFKRKPVYIGLYAEVQKGTATLDVDIMYNDCEGRLTIVGNIYENPELAEAEND